MIGVVYLETAWVMVPRYLKENEERDSLFPAFRRLDSQRWNKWMFYPGAVTFYPIRLFIAALSLVLMVIFVWFVMLGVKRENQPITGWRKPVVLFINQSLTWVICTACGMRIKVNHCDYDYSEYLGMDYLKTQKLPAKASTLVVNHQAWLDSVILISALVPGFAAKIETKKVMVLNSIIENLQSIYISRGGTEQQRKENLDAIIDRQKLVEADPRYPQICIYPEGTQTNGTHLLSYKKGAFVGLYTVQPVVMKYTWQTLSPTWEGMPFMAHQIFMLCWGPYHVEVNILPPFKPNDHLFNVHKDKGTEQWEIFAWAVRDLMAKKGNFKLAT